MEGTAIAPDPLNWLLERLEEQRLEADKSGDEYTVAAVAATEETVRQHDHTHGTVVASEPTRCQACNTAYPCQVLKECAAPFQVRADFPNSLHGSS
jgi:hypothetical protein